MPMNGGIWTLCIDLSDQEMRQLGPNGFLRTAPCVNYLADENMESAHGEDVRNDWQHSESQSSLQPHLSRYNL